MTCTEAAVPKMCSLKSPMREPAVPCQASNRLVGIFGTGVAFVLLYLGRHLFTSTSLATILSLLIAPFIGLLGGPELRLTPIALNDVEERLTHFFVTRLSQLSAVISAIFWSWMWGRLGLVAVTPLTMRLVLKRVREAIAMATEAPRDRRKWWKRYGRISLPDKLNLGREPRKRGERRVGRSQASVKIPPGSRKAESSATVKCRAETRS
jgi:hypothetical protein